MKTIDIEHFFQVHAYNHNEAIVSLTCINVCSQIDGFLVNIIYL